MMAAVHTPSLSQPTCSTGSATAAPAACPLSTSCRGGADPLRWMGACCWELAGSSPCSQTWGSPPRAWHPIQRNPAAWHSRPRAAAHAPVLCWHRAAPRCTQSMGLPLAWPGPQAGAAWAAALAWRSRLLGGSWGTARRGAAGPTAPGATPVSTSHGCSCRRQAHSYGPPGTFKTRSALYCPVDCYTWLPWSQK